MSVTVRAPAKLTLSLRITGVRADGYHFIDAEMVTLDIADTLDVDPEGDGLAASGPFRAGVPIDDTNLVSKALRLVGRRARVEIHKVIPHGGGLGGASADAAAILRWAGYANLDGAASLGADVPFCLVGGRARVGGIGEIVDPLPAIAEQITLVILPVTCSTPAVYAAWDVLGGPRADGPNDLQPAAIVVEPSLARWRDRVREASSADPILAGSGSTWFLRGHHRELTEALADAIVVFCNTETLNGGAET